jgi:bis(5'-nucleosyl)-tetraphosphatase (symmetrical)
MALYLIGDVQGCNAALGKLLEKLQFSPSRDRLFLLGDLVNRGPDNLGVLRRVMALGNSAQCLLGNHDLHLLAIHLGIHRLKPGDTVNDILQAPDRAELIYWLRHQSLALQQEGVLMVHAGVLPTWTAHQTLQLAAEVQTALQGDDWPAFIAQMYGNLPARWDDQLQGMARLRVIVNALTRLRFCTPDGEMEFAHHRGIDEAPAGYLPWFDVPGRQTASSTVAFGHWSALKAMHRQDVIELDTGCVWGGCLSAIQLDALGLGQHQRLQVQCGPEKQISN